MFYSEYFLFTEEEFNNCKSRGKLPCKCTHCGNTFYKQKAKLQEKIKHGDIEIFCDSHCANEHKKVSRITVYCKTCGKEKLITQKEYDNSETKNFFCSHTCSAIYSNSHREITEEHKQKTSKTFQEKYKTKTGFHSRNEMLKSYRKGNLVNKSNKKISFKEEYVWCCPVCGRTIHEECIHPHICKSGYLRQKSPKLQLLGFDMSKKGTKEIYDEYFNLKERMFDLYHNQKKTLTEIVNMYEFNDPKFLTLLFQWLDIPVRTLSEAGHQHYELNGYYDNMSEKELYYLKSEFKFKEEDFKKVKGYELIKQYGMYHSINNQSGVSRDHMISRNYGWLNNIPPEVIAHPANCEMIIQSNNASKGTKCSITLEELYERIEHWND